MGYGEDPPCGPEENPDRSLCDGFKIKLYPTNIDAFNIWRRVSGQTANAFGGGPINANALYATMDRAEIPMEEQLEMFDLIQSVNRSVQKAVAGK